MNGQHASRDIVVLGASAGGVAGLLQLFRHLPDGVPAAFGIVIHRSPVFELSLATLLQKRSKLEFADGRDGDPIEHGRVYIAPRDRHMFFESGGIRLDRGPKQHFTRPAVDPLFASAARSFGSRVVGVLLSGGGDDGSSGLIAIKKAKGISIVQDPREAQCPSMPTQGLLHDDVDAVLPIDRISDALAALARGQDLPEDLDDFAQLAQAQ
jgi:two-component system, chemotaxis family, protein-glutamate methylesterase/glutaminase